MAQAIPGALISESVISQTFNGTNAISLTEAIVEREDWMQAIANSETAMQAIVDSEIAMQVME